VDLGKLQQSIGFEPATRNGGLVEPGRKAGFEDEPDWLMRRLAYLQVTAG